jgi:hypothetical protein
LNGLYSPLTAGGQQHRCGHLASVHHANELLL